jgi:hypothetical protein
MTVDQLKAAWAEYDRLDAVWLASVKDGAQWSTRDNAFQKATVAWSAARAIGPRPAR